MSAPGNGNELGSSKAARSHAERGSEMYRGRPLIIVACLAILVVAAALRVYGAWGDLWLDEILALTMAGQISSPLDIFTTLHSEINHHLYTAYLYFLAPGSNEFIFRLPSLVAGIAAVALAGLIGRRRSAADALFAMLLVGFSYMLVLYSSEARGYAGAVFFAFLSFYVLDRYVMGCVLDAPELGPQHRCVADAPYYLRKWPLALMFSLTRRARFPLPVDFLVVLPFGFCLVGLSAGKVAHRIQKNRCRAALPVMPCPILFFAAFYFVDIRHIGGIGGNPSPSLIDDYGTALAWAIGSPTVPAAQFVACVVGVVALSAGCSCSGGSDPTCTSSFPA